jgi:hypothetical protein
MKQFWVEGLVQLRGRGKKSAPVETFSRAYWAETPAEALHSAENDLQGGAWVEGPRVSLTSEAERMHDMGAPELPGMPAPKKSGRKK